jgi:hypothetical protein
MIDSIIAIFYYPLLYLIIIISTICLKNKKNEIKIKPSIEANLTVYISKGLMNQEIILSVLFLKFDYERCENQPNFEFEAY